MTTRPFQVLGIQQIAIGGPDKMRLQKLWVDMLGLEVTGTFKVVLAEDPRRCAVLGAGHLLEDQETLSRGPHRRDDASRHRCDSA